MSNSRYSPGHTVVHLFAFVLPVVPLGIMPLLHGDSIYPNSYLQLGALWLVGLGVNLGLIVAHEMAHLAVAWVTGIEIREIVIGHWRKLFSARIGKLLVTVRAAPDSGCVIANPTLTLLSGPRVTAFLLAGVLAETVIVLTIWKLFAPFSEISHSFSDYLAIYGQASVFCIGAIHIFANLLPNEGTAGGQNLPTDGKQIWQLWLDRHNRPAQRALFLEAQKIDTLIVERNFATALQLAQSLSARHPDQLGLKRVLGNLHSELGNFDEAQAIWQKLLETPGHTPGQLAEILDSLSCLALYHGRTDLLPRADAWTNVALSYVPAAITLKGTRGGVLVELGRFDEALPLLREVVKYTECPLDKAISLAYLAKIASARGDILAANELLVKARDINSENLAIQRISAELTAANSVDQPQRV